MKTALITAAIVAITLAGFIYAAVNTLADDPNLDW